MLLKLSDFLYMIAFKIKQKAIYFELKWYVKNKISYLKRIHYWERGMGKTHTLLQLAHKYNCPIVVKNSSSENNLQSLSRKYFNNPVKTIICNQSLKGKKFELILCEEGIDLDFDYEVLNSISKCVVGYKSMY